MSSTAQLRGLCGGSFRGGSFRGGLIVVSNREPFVHERRGEKVVCAEPAGGVTAALHPLLSRCGGAWVAHGSGSADREVVDGRSRIMVPPDEPAYALRRVWIPPKLAREYYCGFANQGLWPLCHEARRQPRFAAEDWESYRKVNEMFASAVLEEAAGRPGIVFIQDYHFALLPRLLKRQNPHLRLAHFWHIPWPKPAVFSRLPWKEEVLDGMLGSDLVGFQVREHSANFLEAVTRMGDAAVNRETGRVCRGGHVTAVGNFPIGIDFERHRELAASAATEAAMELWRRRLGPGVRVGIGIDRIDYTKGIPERIRGLDLFLERHPQWREKLVFVQVGVPSRIEIPEYQQLARQIGEQIEAVNARWQTAHWQPIRFIPESLGRTDMMALHRLAEFCLVTPLHDGMNLVAKEFIASREDLGGMLVLSRFAGAAEELDAAVLVDPFAPGAIADGVAIALTLPQTERRSRMARMRVAVRENDTCRWAADILSTLARVTSPYEGKWIATAAASEARVIAGSWAG